MTPVMTFVLRRHQDISNVSGTGDVAWGCEFPDGAVAVRWHGDHPSTAAWNDIRDVEIIHGHQGATEILFDDNARLVRAYKRVMFWMLSARYHDRPLTCDEHPDHPGRLRLVFKDERVWRWWLALLDGSSDTATHEEQNGELRHRWISPDGDLWCEYFSPLADDNEHPLTTFDREDRG